MAVRTELTRRKATVTSAGVAISINDIEVLRPEWVSIFFGPTYRKAIYGTDYTVEVGSDRKFTFTPTTNFIQKLNNVNGVKSTHVVVVERNTKVSSEFSEADAAVRRSVRNMFDRCIMILQEYGLDLASLANETEASAGEFNSLAARAVRVDFTEKLSQLPNTDSRKGKFLGFNATTGDVALFEAPDGVIYSGQLPVYTYPSSLPDPLLMPGQQAVITEAGGAVGASYPLVVVSYGSVWRAVNQSDGYGLLNNADTNLSNNSLLQVPGTMHLFATLTAHRELVMPGIGLFNGATRRITRTGGGAFNLLVKSTAGGPTLVTLPPTTPWVDMTYGVTGWFASAKGTLA